MPRCNCSTFKPGDLVQTTDEYNSKCHTQRVTGRVLSVDGNVVTLCTGEDKISFSSGWLKHNPCPKKRGCCFCWGE